ncbi:Amt family ammonium transporter [Thalassospira sp. MBR-102]|jgi:Amt family ammonium transporter|uniref:Ammonium transporter n=2 Tax=Thalassospira xiamenensis TaxID=220697 RepID=A0ABR5Y656_9PROT|nr:MULTISPECIES: ammonium transporter [Thalassospira]MBR9781247.1 ammonium transporter [Rhodospirillales bacterium]AJD53895.1 ammonium transporter [Thalassospira xiamenensis M-5 = DSM 17429]KZD06610.1 ammonium transporter [Thalassospira xiamenensis]KZD10792.1 ammonium transporter [Thalassospira xiamenensis]MAB32399.1 ammonium transporter [Thalassospira sp.]|tara:strand:+ start:1302 stop:2630 length:1329 start_codon:yes stop_codon:yes gene_type:complete|eukprot:TRINITY_DN51396_c0_g3_i2.p1 TRINITY_DN51396_c0_g3~~TRINITY_DN51396_c0_g3_i2.p1  ORF type:complete len:443 (-),score=143.67 TRINITY_DN51396_c0_g3_i2:222-1550(-)
MNIPMKKTGFAALAGAAALAITSPAFAQDAGVPAETQYILNTFSFLFSGALVMWMAAGFAMLESGLVRTKNVSTILFKNIALFAVAGIMYYLIGYNLMYMDVSGWIGSLSLWSADDAAALGGDFSGGYSATSDWFFQMVFVATAASIVSGTVAERIKLWPFMIFVVVLTGIMYPITGAWTWGGGWLSEMGFADFAGSTIVHSVGGWAALTGAIILGARKGKYGADGSVHPMPGSNLPLATLGTFVLWLGWFGFNGGSQLAMGSAADVIAIANIYGNTSMAAAGGVVAAAILTQILYKKVDLTMALNGALAGLVSITAGPDTPTIGSAIIIGAIGGILVVVAVPLLDKLKIDDVVGAVSVHLVCGIWGTMAVPFTNDGASFGVQLTGVVAMGAFTIVASAIVWLILKFTVGIRLSEEEEALGSDAVELGLEAYPEFGKGSQRF